MQRLQTMRSLNGDLQPLPERRCLARSTAEPLVQTAAGHKLHHDRLLLLADTLHRKYEHARMPKRAYHYADDVAVRNRARRRDFLLIAAQLVLGI